MKKNRLSYRFYSLSTIEKMEKKVKMLGYNSRMNPINFLNFRLISFVLLFFVIVYTNRLGMVLALPLSIIYFYLLTYIFIDRKLNRRRNRLNMDALYFFEILTLSLESGKDLRASLLLTADNIDSILADEVRNSLQMVKYGKTFNEAMKELISTIPSDDINNILLSIMESNSSGNNILDIMYEQIEYLRNKQVMDAKALINKIPLKVSVISVLFLIPLILLLILAPTIINYLS